MIKETCVNATLSAASAITSVGKVALPAPGTLVSELVRLSVPVSFSNADGKPITLTNPKVGGDGVDTCLSMFATEVELNTTGDIKNPTLHSLEMDSFINDISKAVTQHVANARNVVRPIVVTFAEELQTFLTNAKPREASEQALIKTVRLAALLKDESFLDTLTPYKDKTVLTPDVSFALEPKSKEELDALIMIGHARSDKLVAEWLSHMPEVFLLNVWNSFFSRGGVQLEGSVSYNYNDLGVLNGFAKADVALAILLFARKISGEVQPSNMELSKYQYMCSQYVEYGSTLLIDALNKVNLAIRTKALIIEKNSFKLEVSVNGEVYPQWLQAGGTPEAILGALISEGSGFTQSLIDEKRDEYLRAWNSYCLFFRTRELNNSFTYAKNFIENLFLTGMRSLHDSEQEIAKTNSTFQEKIIANAKIYLDSIKPDDLKDPYNIALKLIAGIRFSYTSSYQILNDINEAGKINPNADVREAALLAVINYVSDFVADQINVT